MALRLIAVAVLAVHGAPWKHAVVTRAAGTLSATLAYDVRPAFDSHELRHATLLVRRHGAVVLARKLDLGFDDHASLVLRNVWGSAEPEALVELRGCGNRCGYSLYVGVASTGVLLHYDFGVEFPGSRDFAAGWSAQSRGSLFEFVADDSRFFCEFTDCASSSMPVQVLAIDPTGRRFVDVSRTRPDLLIPDAESLWHGYLGEHAHPYKSFDNSYNWYGTLVPYCADEYRLGVYTYCDRVLPASIKRQLAAWGYS